MINDVLHDADQRMKKTADALRHTLVSIRTGRASISLVENLQVEAYDDMLPLNQLATLSTPDARTIAIQPFDTSMIKAIEKAIKVSDLGLNPNNDGRMVRLNLPPLTEERRKELVKQVRVKVEEAKVALRNIRREALDDIKQLESEKMISEDEQRRGGDKLQEHVEKAYSVKNWTPISAAARIIGRMFSTPARCPAWRESPRCLAQRPLPSMMTAIWRGTPLVCEGVVASLIAD